MFSFKNKCIEINGNKMEFDYDIRTIKKYKENYIILVGIPFDKTDINNIYCLDEQAKIIWQSEDLNKLYPTLMNSAYERMEIVDGVIFAGDFFGRNYLINMETGKIEGCIIGK